MSQTWNILSRSNDPRMKDFDRNCPVSNIYKVDENSLYASVMCMKLPIGEWEEINPSCKSLADWIEFLRTIEDDLNSNLSLDEKYAMVDGNEPRWKQGEHCYIIWATLDCSNPEYIKKWNEMSLCPMRQEIKEFSDRNLPIAEEEPYDKEKKCVTVSRLTSSLYPVTEPHPFYYLQLKQFLEQGGKITGITRVVRAKQEPFMKEFCMSVQELRKGARSDFEDKLYKLILNALYGKTIMDESRFCNSQFIDNPDKLRKEMRDVSNLDTLSVISPNMVFMMKKRTEFEYTSPVGVGFAVLGLSKWMVARHWIMLKEKYGDDIRAIQTDTDSIHFKLYEHDLYEDLKVDLDEKKKLTKEEIVGGDGGALRQWFSDIFDLSSLPKEHPCFNVNHKKCFGYLKIENKGKPIDYFVAPVVKGYFEVIGEKTKATLKGVKEKQRKELTKKDFEECVLLLKKGPEVCFLSFRIPDEHGETTVLVIKDSFVFHISPSTLSNVLLPSNLRKTENEPKPTPTGLVYSNSVLFFIIQTIFGDVTDKVSRLLTSLISFSQFIWIINKLAITEPTFIHNCLSIQSVQN